MLSNPYYALAKELGFNHQDYGDILNYVMSLEKGMRELNYWERRAARRFQKSPMGEAVMRVWQAEKARREAINEVPSGSS